MKNSLIIGLIALIIGVGIGYLLGKPEEQPNLSPKDFKLLNFLKEVNKSKTPKLRDTKRLTIDTANTYAEIYYSALNYCRYTKCENPIHKEFLENISKSQGGWSMNLAALSNIWNKNKDVKYLYFYPAINDSEKAMTLISVGAKVYDNGRNDSLILVHGKVPKLAGEPDEIWDNASPCPSNCPGNGIR